MGLREHLEPALYDLTVRGFERRPDIAAVRDRLLAGAQGRVLEVGAGTGFNVSHYPAGTELVLTDELDGMVRRAARRAGRAGRKVETVAAAVERLPFPDDSFDTVAASFLLCSVRDQDRALAEIRRVLKPGGGYLFLEHVRSAERRIARRQDRLQTLWSAFAFGCRPNRDTLPRIEAAFALDEIERGILPAGPTIVRPYVLGRAVAR